jgi:hypothetical protein
MIRAGLGVGAAEPLRADSSPAAPGRIGGAKRQLIIAPGVTYPSFRPPVPPWIGFLVLPAAAGVRDELELRPNVSFSLCFMSLTEHRFTRTITIRFSTS